MFHQGDNLFFGRLLNGDVRMLKLKHTPERWPEASLVYPASAVVFDHTIPQGHWCSIVASVSNLGEQSGRYYEAKAFHMNARRTDLKKEAP